MPEPNPFMQSQLGLDFEVDLALSHSALLLHVVPEIRPANHEHIFFFTNLKVIEMSLNSFEGSKTGSMP